MTLPSSKVNLCCVACRAAKVKCDHATPTCSRCARLSISCEFEKRRSKWDSSNARRPPAALVEQPEYESLILSLAKYKPGWSSKCFQDTVVDKLDQLVRAATLRDDAAAISWVTAQMHEHGIPLSKCPSFQRLADGGGNSSADVLDPTSHTSLPPALAAVYEGEEPCFAWVCIAGRKTYMCNRAFPIDASQLQAAQSLEEMADLIGVARNDHARGMEDFHTALTAEKAQARRLSPYSSPVSPLTHSPPLPSRYVAALTPPRRVCPHFACRPPTSRTSTAS